MTTATSAEISQFMDFEVPEELPESSSTWVGRVIAAGAQLPPAKMSAKSNNNHLHFHTIIQPLSLTYDSDLSIFEDNFEHIWTPMYDKNNKLQGPQSNFGELKAAFAKCGYVITNSASAQALVGRVFTFANRKRTINFKKIVDGESRDDPRDTWLNLPEKVELDSWQPMSPVSVTKRPRQASAAPNAATVGSNENVAIPILRVVLLGKAESEYFETIVNSGNAEITQAPYVVEASTNAPALTARLTAVGMRMVDGRLSN